MPEPIVGIVRNKAVGPTGLLDEAITLIRFREKVRARIKEKTLRQSEFSVVIVPAFDAFAANSPAATDPNLVEHLIDILFDLGVTRVIVGSTKGTLSLWLDNRDVYVVADLLGYRYETPKGRSYDVIDLAEDLLHDVFPETGPLAGTGLSREWLEADLRIVFSANRTDEDDGYALCFSTLLSVLPLADKDYHYRHKRDIGAVAAALGAVKQVDFAFIDAVISAHGNGGGRSPQALRTDTIIAASDPALADHHGAILMGLDPFVSAVAAPMLRQPRLLDGVRVFGPLDPYPSWRNAHSVLRKSVALRRQTIAIDRAMRPLLQETDRSLFPFREAVHDRLNAVLVPLFAETDDREETINRIALLNFWLGEMGRAGTVWATLANKDALRRREAPLNVDPAEIHDSAFDAIATELFPVIELLRGVPADATGLRWRMHDGAILFDGVRRFPIPFEDFVSIVEIRRTIQFMNDYIGGSAFSVRRDQTGRTTRQIERNLYLPQPNYTVLAGGDVIDVTKIEAITYAPHRHSMVWKTIKSENGSAISDDGIVTFQAIGEDTVVSIFGRQQFRLPPLLEAIDLDLLPALQRLLVTDAYARFFRGTFANLEAVAEGRDVRVGRAWAEDGAEEELVTERLARIVSALQADKGLDVIGWLKARFDAPVRAGPAPIEIDADGFHHFTASARAAPGSTVAGILRDIIVDLRQAALVDTGIRR
jgi:Domain of unknown function (DUF362)